MSRLATYPTSFLGAICHTFAGLSSMAAVLWVFPAVAFFAPSLVTGLGSAAGLDLTGLVEAVRSAEAVTTVTLLGSFVVFAVGYVGLKAAGDRLYAIGRSGSGGQAAGGATAGHQTGAAGGETDYVRTFGNFSLVVGGIVVLLGLVLLFNPELIPAALFGTDRGSFLLQVFGLGGIYLLAGYGARHSSIEAVFLGTGIFSLRFVLGLATLNTFGIITGGLGAYYGVRGLLGGRLEWKVLAAVRERRQPGGTPRGRQVPGQQPPQSQQGQSQPPGARQSSPAGSQQPQGENPASGRPQGAHEPETESTATDSEDESN